MTAELSSAQTPLSARPLVSCLMVTLNLPSRFQFVKIAIESYCRQTLDEKELIIIADDRGDETTRALAEFVSVLGRSDIRLFLVPEGQTLGELRNLSVKLASGEIICQWDDDDLYHPRRLRAQLECLVEGDFEAVLIQNLVQYYPAEKLMYLTNWRATELGGHPGTLMARRSTRLAYPSSGPAARLGEDRMVALDLIASGRVGYVCDQPCLFIYVSHGANSWSEEHHRMLSRELAASAAFLKRREASIRDDMRAFDSLPSNIEFRGSNGPAFAL